MLVFPAKRKTTAKTKTRIIPRKVPVLLSILICTAQDYFKPAEEADPNS
jgi:hypothetical protein